MIKTITAGVLAASLTLTGLAPTTATADISREEAIVGIGALLLLGAAIHNNRDDNDRARTQTRPTISITGNTRTGTTRHDNTARPNDRWRVLPAACLTDARTRRGETVRFFGQRCLTNSYATMGRLPQACRIQFRSQTGNTRQGYDARCLRDAGFRTTRR